MQVFREFDNITQAEIPKTDQEKLHTWIVNLCDATQHNLIPLFKFWGFGINDEDIPVESIFPAFLPDDEITRQYGPARTKMILNEFKDILRYPVNTP